MPTAWWFGMGVSFGFSLMLVLALPAGRKAPAVVLLFICTVITVAAISST